MPSYRVPLDIDESEGAIMTHERKAKLYGLYDSDNYDIIDAETGHWVTQSIQGGDAMRATWTVGDEAWPTGEGRFCGEPVAVAVEPEEERA